MGIDLDELDSDRGARVGGAAVFRELWSADGPLHRMSLHEMARPPLLAAALFALSFLVVAIFVPETAPLPLSAAELRAALKEAALPAMPSIPKHMPSFDPTQVRDRATPKQARARARAS